MNEALPDLVARFRVRQGLFRKELVEAALYELDGYGCVMKTDKVFNPGDTVVLDLVMDMPFDKIRAEGLRLSSNGLRMVTADGAEDDCGTANDRFDPSVQLNSV